MPGFIIAIDGPAASGKGTLARRIADHFGLAYLDTGLMYRATGIRVLRAAGNPSDPRDAEFAAEQLEFSDLSDPDLRLDTTAGAASQVAAMPAVRDILVSRQRAFAAEPPPGQKGVVLDGRDIGTVVCPDADAKLFITASPKIRADRRAKELKARGLDVIDSDVLREMRARDARDSGRSVAPLRPADDATVVDTSDLDADQVFQVALSILRDRCPGLFALERLSGSS